MNHTGEPQTSQLKQTLGPVTLWGLGVGYVISGEYFGWNLGLPAGGTLGLAVAFVLVTVMYVTFVLSYAEMACALPRAGGLFVYARRGLGPFPGFLAGIAQLAEFIFAPPAIAWAVGSYAQTWSNSIDPKWAAVGAFCVFTALNLWGIQQVALFELCITILAVGEILLFTTTVAPHFQWDHFVANSWPNGWLGVWAAMPFAVWFYLAIEGIANAAEEAKNPQRDLIRGFTSAMITLAILAGCVLIFSVGVGGWERIVYNPHDLTATPGGWQIAEGAKPSDSPLPLAMMQVVSTKHVLYHVLLGVGGLGLIASLNGIILIAGRALFEMGRAGFLPKILGTIHPRWKTPVGALLANLVFGIAAILFLDTGGLITLSAMGACTIYLLAIPALFRLRQLEPDLPRPFRVPGYPVVPLIAGTLAVITLTAMLYSNFDPRNLAGSMTVWYALLWVAATAYYGLILRPQMNAQLVAAETTPAIEAP